MENVTTDTGAEFPPAPVSFCARTVKVIVRHSEDCKDRDRGGDWRKCRCPKALLVYEGQGSGTNRRVSAKTRSWEQAERRAQELRDLWDPEKSQTEGAAGGEGTAAGPAGRGRSLIPCRPDSPVGGQRHRAEFSLAPWLPQPRNQDCHQSRSSVQVD
jgi:hypothetical protein